MAPAYEQRLEVALASRLERGMLRSLDPRPKQKANLVDFSSNDYISFGRSRRLRQKLVSSLEEPESVPVYGPPSSRLLDGNSPLHAGLELGLAAFFRAPSALLFNSGFDANVGLWTCLADQHDWIVYDRLVHASMHDGMRSSRVPASQRRAFAHNSVRNLTELLDEIASRDEAVRDGRRSVWIGVESLYSMDGDLAPLEEIVQAVEAALPRGNGHIIVDEAHSTGLYGPNGRGLVCALGLAHRVLVRVHTFGKAMACSGAAVLASPLIRNYLINYARPLIYSTAMTHLSVLAVQKSLEMLEEGEADPASLSPVHMLAKRLVTRLAASLPPTPPCPTRNVLLPPHLVAIATVPATTSPIIPLLTGSPRPLSAFLQARGYLVRPITYPTVPRGEERVRVCLHAANTIDEVDGLADAVSEWVMRGSGRGGEDEARAVMGVESVAAAAAIPRARL
ncbi:PLP-dependent transferase [Rhodotorula sp. JG-1b]|nr:PLP-dependent transferase [Rhodotorula sp. JG-1b]